MQRNLKSGYTKTNILECVKPLYEVTQALMEYFELQLQLAPPEVTEYLNRRGLTKEIIDLFHIGYCPDGQQVYDFVVSHKDWDKLLDTIGFWKTLESGDIVVKFANRIMFPIMDLDGSVHGFSGRILTNEKTDDKYTNTNNCSVYNKSLMVYGIREALICNQAIDKWIFVEGNMDVVSMFRAGYTTTIACNGTAVTEYQLRRLAAYCNNFVVIFDNDDAGKKATRNIQQLANNLKLNMKIGALSDVKDVDEAIQTNRTQLIDEILA